MDTGRINVSQVKDVIKRVDEYTESYNATLLNGDSVGCSYFLQGLEKGQIGSDLYRVGKDGFIRELRINKENFYILKALYEQSQSHPIIAELD